MKTYEVRVKNINDEIVTMAIEAESLSAAQSKCREIGLEVLDDNNKNCEISSDNNESMHVNRNTNKYLIIIIVSIGISIGIVLGVLWNISSALTKDRIAGLIAFATDERKCFNYYKDNNYFKDPDSAYIDTSTILTKKNDKEELKLYYPHILDKKSSFNSIIEVRVFAKNSLGGYVSDKIECPLGNKYNNSMKTRMAVKKGDRPRLNITRVKKVCLIGNHSVFPFLASPPLRNSLKGWVGGNRAGFVQPSAVDPVLLNKFTGF